MWNEGLGIKNQFSFKTRSFYIYIYRGSIYLRLMHVNMNQHSRSNHFMWLKTNTHMHYWSFADVAHDTPHKNVIWSRTVGLINITKIYKDGKYNLVLNGPHHLTRFVRIVIAIRNVFQSLSFLSSLKMTKRIVNRTTESNFLIRI